MNKPPTDGIRIGADPLRAFIVELFTKVSVPHNDAVIVADLLVDTELRGVVSHGVEKVIWYVTACRDGVYNPEPTIEVLRETPAIATLNGDGGLGMLVGKRAMEIAIDKARKLGVGVATSTNSGHLGSVGKYARMAMRADMIGISFGGRCASMEYSPESTIIGSIQGSPPMAFAIPSGPGQPYFLLDMATHMPYHESAFREMQEVLIKRIGISHVANILSGVLGGQMVPPLDRQNRKYLTADQSGFYMALDINQFVPLEAFKQDMNDLMERVRRMKPFPGHTETWLPGGPNWKWEQVYAREGIPVGAEVAEQVAALADELGVVVPWRSEK